MGTKTQLKKDIKRGTLVHVTWDGLDDPEVTLADLALLMCVDVEEVVEDLIKLPQNEAAAAFVVKGSIKEFVDEAVSEGLSKLADVILGEAELDDIDPDEEELIETPLLRWVSYSESARYMVTAIAFGDFPDLWRIDLKETGGVVLQWETKAEWKVCRAKQSVFAQFDDRITRYQDLVLGLLPDLEAMEALIKEVDEDTKAWSERTGKRGGREGLEALAMLNLIKRTADVQSGRDPSARQVMHEADDLIEACGPLLDKSLAKAISFQLDKIRRKYFDPELNERLLEFMLEWHPDEHYYFHAVAAKAVGAKDFDKRLFSAITEFGRCMVLSETAGNQAGREARIAIERVFARTQRKAAGEAVGVTLAEDADLGGLQTSARAFFGEQKTESHGIGFITTLSVWSGYISTYVGNFEGPPSVLSQLLTWLSRSESFMKNVDANTWTMTIAMIGVSRDERRVIEAAVKKKDFKTASSLYANGSWRSPAIFRVFQVFGLAMLLNDAVELQRLLDDGDIDDARELIVKQVMGVVMDVGNLGLIFVTQSYSRDLSGFLAANARASVEEVAAKIEHLETRGVRPLLAKTFHRGIAVVGFALTSWDLYASNHKLDTTEKILMWGTVGASFASVLGAFGVCSALGPAGFVAGLLLAAALQVYETHFKAELKSLLRGLIDALEDSPFVIRNKGKTVRRDWALVFEVRDDLEDVLEELAKSIVAVDWKTLRESDAIHFHRAGYDKRQIASIYKLNKKEAESLLKKQRYALEKRSKVALQPDAIWIKPDPRAVSLIVGEMNEVEVVLSNHPDVTATSSPRAWLTWAGPGDDPDQFLHDGVGHDEGGSTYHPGSQAVLLEIASGSSKTRARLIGRFRLQEHTGETITKRGKKVEIARFKLRVPKDVNARFTDVDKEPDVLFTKPLYLPIAP